MIFIKRKELNPDQRFSLKKRTKLQLMVLIKKIEPPNTSVYKCYIYTLGNLGLVCGLILIAYEYHCFGWKDLGHTKVGCI
jgi:hypothetical protein